jgi:hypothetical protein
VIGVVATGLTAWDTQQIKEMYVDEAYAGGEAATKTATGRADSTSTSSTVHDAAAGGTPRLKQPAEPTFDTLGLAPRRFSLNAWPGLAPGRFCLKVERAGLLLARAADAAFATTERKTAAQAEQEEV